VVVRNSQNDGRSRSVRSARGNGRRRGLLSPTGREVCSLARANERKCHFLRLLASLGEEEEQRRGMFASQPGRVHDLMVVAGESDLLPPSIRVASVDAFFAVHLRGRACLLAGRGHQGGGAREARIGQRGGGERTLINASWIVGKRRLSLHCRPLKEAAARHTQHTAHSTQHTAHSTASTHP